jgi:hypothetical protein
MHAVQTPAAPSIFWSSRKSSVCFIIQANWLLVADTFRRAGILLFVGGLCVEFVRGYFLPAGGHLMLWVFFGIESRCAVSVSRPNCTPKLSF